MPIYYVLMEQVRQPGMLLTVWKIIKVIETTYDEASELYEKEVAPLVHSTGGYFQIFYIYREPPNPFRESGLN